MIAYAGAGWINAIWGWRAAFFVFGLPGNPVSVFVAFEQFARPLMAQLGWPTIFCHRHFRLRPP